MDFFERARPERTTLAEEEHGLVELPVTPDAVDPDGTASFNDAPSGVWFDPPLTDGYAYETADGSSFTAILDVPTGFASPFEVRVEGQSLEQMNPGDQLVFPGDGVATFTVLGITPPDDLADGADFPLQLAFDAPTADFTMTPIIIPEPAWLTLIMLTFLVGCRRRRTS